MSMEAASWIVTDLNFFEESFSASYLCSDPLLFSLNESVSADSTCLQVLPISSSHYCHGAFHHSL